MKKNHRRHQRGNKSTHNKLSVSQVLTSSHLIDPRAQLYPCTSYSAFSVHSYISPIHSLHSGSLRGDAPPMALSISGAGVRVHAGHTSMCNVCTETAPSQSRNSREKQIWGETPHSRLVPRSKVLVSSPPALNILQVWPWSRNPRAHCTC